MPPSRFVPPPTKFGAPPVRDRAGAAPPAPQPRQWLAQAVQPAMAPRRPVPPPAVLPPAAATRPAARIMTAPPAPAQGAPKAGAAIQRAASTRRSSVDLSTLGALYLRMAKAGNSETQEVQILDAGEGMNISSNTTTLSTDALASIKKFNTYIDGENASIRAHQDKFVKIKKDRTTRVPEDLGVIGGSLHGEQNLLKDYARKLKNAESNGTLDQLDKTIRVFGGKPPCNICKKVMAAYAAALTEVYTFTLRYSTATGDTSVLESAAGKLSVADMTSAAGGGTMPEKFTAFLAAYERNLT